MNKSVRFPLSNPDGSRNTASYWLHIRCYLNFNIIDSLGCAVVLKDDEPFNLGNKGLVKD